MIAGQGQLADDLANAAKAVVLRLIDERRYLRRVARDEQESLPALREAADDAAIVRVFVDAVAIAAEQRDDLIEEFSAVRPDPRDILEKDDRNRAVFVGLEREPDSAQGERSEEHTSELQSLMRISYAV